VRPPGQKKIFAESDKKPAGGKSRWKRKKQIQKEKKQKPRPEGEKRNIFKKTPTLIAKKRKWWVFV
jgi:hypothetical protein